MDDDTEKEIIDTENNVGISGALSSTEKLTNGKVKYQYSVRYEKMMDISGVESVELNGEEILLK